MKDYVLLYNFEGATQTNPPSYLLNMGQNIHVNLNLCTKQCSQMSVSLNDTYPGLAQCYFLSRPERAQ